ncbi:RICIN domain-containing protein [Hoeflea sp. G2-23]|uniref:RICIN domain-containing protein n=1 Tax=Hoeflea algicola TaxID=2983763 RepID=A0ABT3Z624_9HYPH|nr:hypothetical protein [Hoeflea algicola]MCY0147219.1 RICIN domain-containing protein [Hoeflea algicola]
MVLATTLSVTMPAKAQQYAADGIALTPTFRIKSKFDNTYLKSSGRHISLTTALAPDDDSFLWVFVDGKGDDYTIANVATGWILIRPRNSASVYATVTEGRLVDLWTVKDGTNSYQYMGRSREL